MELERILQRVQRPARYVGGEWNSVQKDWDSVRVRFAFAFPDVYEVGMSHLGLQILYGVVNGRSDALMERVFAPWPDMEEEMRKHGLPLFALESRRPVRDFDIVGFTLQYEMSYSNVINMLDLAGIPLYSCWRGPGDPLVVAGGPCAYNPEPLADFIDAFVVGEGEEVIGELIDVYLEHGREDRQGLLYQLAKVPGVYVPSLYRVDYSSSGAVIGVRPLAEGVPLPVVRRVVADLEGAFFPVRPIVPNLSVVHDRIMLEVQRGCSRGCRFCQAGMIYRPVREREPETILARAGEAVSATGWGEISLTSLSTADYSSIGPLVEELVNRYGSLGINVSLPSLRADSFSVELAREVQRVRRSGLTFAPEAGTQRLRDVINKGVTEEDLCEAVSAAFAAGWTAVKLYFMIGLPTETTEDLDGIVRLARRVVEIGREKGVPGKRLRVTVSVSSFVPKPHTPFQWEPQDRLEVLMEKQAYLRRFLRGPNLVFNWHDPEMSFLEAVFARGDRRLGGVLEEAWRLGCRFDSWDEHFDFSRWREAFRRRGLEPKFYAYRRYGYEDVLPWDHIDSGVSRSYLVLEHQRAMAGMRTPDCRAGRCSGCGLCFTLGVQPRMAGGGSVVPLPD